MSLVGDSLRAAAGHARPHRPQGRRGGIRAFLLALGMHVLLFAMLFVGVRWQTQRPAAVQAELWTPSAPVEPAPPPPPEPAPPPRPVETPPPAPAPAPPKPLPVPKPDIALERERQEKLRREEERVRQEAQAKKEREAQARRDELARKEAQAKKEAQERKEALEKKQAQEKKLAQEKKESERQEAEKAREQQRRHDDYVKRMVTEAGPSDRTGAPGAPVGGAVGGPSGAANADYAAKLASLIRANTVFVVPPDLAGNPKAVFLVTLLPDCSIASVKLRRSSGHAGWDQAAERGIARSDPMPRMANGRCPPELEIARGPRDDR